MRRNTSSGWGDGTTGVGWPGMVKSLYNYRLSDEDLISIGRLMVGFAMFESHLNYILFTLRGRAERDVIPSHPTELAGRKLKEVKKLMNRGVAPEIDSFWQEIRLSMAHALPARNMVGHGVLVYATDGEISFWSQSRLKELPLSSVLGAEKWVNYAIHAAFHAQQHLNPNPDGTVHVPQPLPDRPA
ncbi:MAG: hypothetical protein Q7J13_12960 [Brevundimonas sp.]|uniref:hypothetical protein n=1 Tax=Brevundimonas sp. TaxID=1871086 RepID=UPI00271660A6|nr:hypothetical protein [Brevundimonas sp.]MDO9588828.1 hypothetical protein [Brevundimonas sp.]